jgi:hypothetical protein
MTHEAQGRREGPCQPSVPVTWTGSGESLSAIADLTGRWVPGPIPVMFFDLSTTPRHDFLDLWWPQPLAEGDRRPGASPGDALHGEGATANPAATSLSFHAQVSC